MASSFNDGITNKDEEQQQEQHHTTIILDGKATAAQIQNELMEEVERLQTEHHITPGLAVVLVGKRTDSATYVRMKKKVATAMGIYTVDVMIENETITEHELIQHIHELNENDKIHGILIQLPLPSHMNEYNVVTSIRYEKDVDGFHPLNIGNMCLKGGIPPLAIPCTPAGCIELLQRYNITIAGKDCVVLGRSNIVGMPVAALLTSCNATVTICHSKTNHIVDKLKNADIIVAAIGKPHYVRGEHIKPGCIIVDVGINSIEDHTKKSGYALVGDVHYEECYPMASYITPVPGGIGTCRHDCNHT
jgi:5,10-methylene-tetrahydrofolate dehydrogenase/methenyl tetrahydrofolate cyclohydrolase